LTIRRQPAYVPYVARTLNNLAALHFTQGDLTLAHELNAEALTINRTLWQHHPTVHGDALARTLVLKVMLLQQERAEVVTVCALLQELGTVTYSNSLKVWSQEHMKISCSQGTPP
jgi:hypothetical protein